MRSIYDVLPLLLPAVCLLACAVSDCAIRKLIRTPRGLTWLRLTNVDSLYLIYPLHLNRDTSVQEFPLLYFNKKDSLCWPIYWQSKPSLKLLDCGREIQNVVHIDIYYCKPELISWRKISITVFYMRFLSPTDKKCAVLSTYWQFFYYRPPGKFR